jgi:hypothetical protein
LSATLNVSVFPAGPIVPADAIVGVPSAAETSASAVVVVVVAAAEVVVVVLEAAVLSGLEVADVELPPEHAPSAAASTKATAGRSCRGMTTLVTLLFVVLAVAGLAWAARMGPQRMADDGTWFDCEYQIIDADPAAERWRFRWYNARGTVVDELIELRAGRFRGSASFGAPLSVVQRAPKTRWGRSVYLLTAPETMVAIAVRQRSPADNRLSSMLA